MKIIVLVVRKFPLLIFVYKEPSFSSVCAPITINIDISTSLSLDDARCAAYLADPLAANPLQFDRQFRSN